MTHQIARRLVASGHTVEWFSAMYPGARSEEDIDGIHVVRAGQQWTVHWHAFRRYRGKLRGKFDAVIDQVNTIPFFTPLWAQVPSLMFIHQLAREVWWYESPFPINALGYFGESLYLRCYRRAAVLTVSQSTEKDLREIGFVGPITILPEGLEPIEVSPVDTRRAPNFIYVGRLAPSKRVEHVITAFARFSALVAQSRLWLIGIGSDRYVRSLKKLIKELGLESATEFLGRTPSDEKHRRMAEAYALLMTSAREGWGLVVTEANACGTPAIVYNVPGLRDAVRNQVTGLTVDPIPTSLAQAMLRLWRDPDLRSRLGVAAKTWSRDFTFERSAEVFAQAVSGVVG